MATYIVRRLFYAVLVLLLVSFGIFSIIRLLPGDPILLLITGDELAQASEERIAYLRQEYGLDKPFLVQYVLWLKDLARGDLGISVIRRSDVREEILGRLPVSVYLGFIAFAMGGLLGGFLGIVSAVRRGKWLDSVVTFLANLGITAPTFWLAALLIYFLGVYLKVLPFFGYTSPFQDFWLSVKQITMPVLCLSAYPVAATARQMRSSMLEVMRQDFIRTAWAKGLAENLVIIRHALKNALIPVVTLQGLILRFLIGGAVVVETVFGIPGLGRLAVEAVIAKDYPTVQGVIVVIAVIVVLINLVIDLLYGWLDPRIRYE